MKRFIEIIFCISILLISYSCTQDSNRKTAYELQERCGKSAVHWSEQHNEVIDYKAHYNSSLNKCIVYATLAPIVGSNVITSYYMLYDVNAHSKLGQYTVRSYKDSEEEHICIIDGKDYGFQSKEKWDSLVKEMMNST
jgi:hypothetical protein